MVDTYSSVRLVVNSSKTEVFCQLTPRLNPPPDSLFHVVTDEFSNVDSFILSRQRAVFLLQSRKQDPESHSSCPKCLRSIIRICLLNINLTNTTKVAMYTAVCISTLLYGCESWTMFRVHVRKLEAYHIQCCLLHILGLTWADRISHFTILQSISCLSIEALLMCRMLRWVGHVIRMPETRLPHIFLSMEN